MKLSKIARIVKRSRVIDVIDVGGRQWVYVGAAAYAIDGLPPITDGDQLLAVMDIPADEREDYTVRIGPAEGELWTALLAEDMACDASARIGEVLIEWDGVLHVPLIPDGRGAPVWINDLYTIPYAGDEVAYSIREVGGQRVAAVRRGLSLIAVIAPRKISAEMWEALDECCAVRIRPEEAPEAEGDGHAFRQMWLARA